MKKEYSSPEVVVYGRIDQLTLGEGDGGLDDWVFGNIRQPSSVACSRSVDTGTAVYLDCK